VLGVFGGCVVIATFTGNKGVKMNYPPTVLIRIMAGWGISEERMPVNLC